MQDRREICTKAAAAAFLKKRKNWQNQTSRMFLLKDINCDKQDSPKSVGKGGQWRRSRVVATFEGFSDVGIQVLFK